MLFDNVLNMCGERGGAEVWLNYLWFLGGGGGVITFLFCSDGGGGGGGGANEISKMDQDLSRLSPPPSPRHLSNAIPLLELLSISSHCYTERNN